MNSSQTSARSELVDSFIPTPMTVLPNSLSFETSGEKSESPERIAKVSMWSLVRHISTASTARRISAEFLPV